MSEIKKQTIKEWQAEMKNLFKSRQDVAFVCPACGKVASIKDHVDAGGTEDNAPQQCIGRTNRKGGKDGKDNGFGCNWAAFGLFGTLGKGREIALPDGKPIHVFDFAVTEVPE